MNPDKEQQIADLELRMKKLEDTMLTHEHAGRDSKQLRQVNILPQVRASGSITMATDGRTYTLGLITNPTQILFYGVAIHYVLGDATAETPGPIDIRSHVVGSAQLGPSLYFQPKDEFSVTAQSALLNIIQSSSALTIKSVGPTTVNAGSFVVGVLYYIATVGTTDFTLIGATANTVGLNFVATGVGTGNGTALQQFPTVTTVSEEHMIRVGYPNNSAANIAADATVTVFGTDHIDIVATLKPGWAIIGNFVVT